VDLAPVQCSKITAPNRQPLLATSDTRAERTALDALPGHPLAAHIDDFRTDLAKANKPRNTIRVYRGDLIAFATHHDGAVADRTTRRIVVIPS
jgi:hypothetical protein